jgi:mitochondrial ornithine carrier protein
MAENAVLFLAYNQIQHFIKSSRGIHPEKSLSINDLCLAGGMSGALVSFVLTPIELLKCRLQTQGYLHQSPKFSGPFSVLMHTIRHGGITALYQGHTGTMMREIAGGVAWFGVYEFTVQKMIEKSRFVKTKSDLSAWQLMGAGALAGMSYNAALYPADVVKSRMQSGLHGKDGFLKVTRDIYRNFGAKFFLRGFGLTVARSAPSSGVIFFTYEYLVRSFGIA